MSYFRPFNRPAAVSEAQVRFLADLVTKHDVPAWIIDLSLTLKVGDPKGSEVSRAIDEAKKCLWRAKPSDLLPVTVAEKGYYKVDGNIYTVVSGKKDKTRSYAKILVNEGNRGHWDYARGMVMKLQPENRITIQEAKEFGHLHGFCMCCGKTLTDPKSVEAGVGPICQKSI